MLLNVRSQIQKGRASDLQEWCILFVWYTCPSYNKIEKDLYPPKIFFKKVIIWIYMWQVIIWIYMWHFKNQNCALEFNLCHRTQLRSFHEMKSTCSFIDLSHSTPPGNCGWTKLPHHSNPQIHCLFRHLEQPFLNCKANVTFKHFFMLNLSVFVIFQGE